MKAYDVSVKIIKMSCIIRDCLGVLIHIILLFILMYIIKHLLQYV